MAPQRRYFTQAEFARLFNVSEAEISRAVHNGRIKRQMRQGRYMIDLKTEAEKFAATSKHIFNRVPSPAILAGSAGAAAASEEERTENTFNTFANKQSQERYKALKAKMEYEKQIGELVPISEVENQWARVAVMIRKTVLNLPDRLAPLLAAEDDARRCWALMDRECRTILEDLADDLGNDQS